MIAVCQILIAISLFSGGRSAKLGALGAMVFLVGIAPLGLGSAFPASLLMAVGCYYLFREKMTEDLFSAFRGWIYHKSPKRKN